MIVRRPAAGRDPVRVAPPVRGRWTVLNGPGSKVPSHGTRSNGQSYAVDFTSPNDGGPIVSGFGAGSQPEAYPCFGASVYASAPGEVTQVVSDRADHRARDTWPSLLWMVTGEGILRSFGGFAALGGNHVIVTEADGTSTVYAHLKRDSPTVSVGDMVTTGQELGRVGNSGNSSTPHLHIHRQEDPSPRSSSGVPMLFYGATDTGEVDPSLAKYLKSPAHGALEDFPPDGTIIEFADS